jgi:hypothetical protein
MAIPSLAQRWVCARQCPPTLAGPPNPIQISNAGEDTALTPDGRFPVVCDGNLDDPVSVVDVATRTEVSTFDVGSPCTGVEVCDTGSVLVASSVDSTVRRLTIDGGGTLTDTGEEINLTIGGTPNDLACAPGGGAVVAISYSEERRSWIRGRCAPCARPRTRTARIRTLPPIRPT